MNDGRTVSIVISEVPKEQLWIAFKPERSVDGSDWGLQDIKLQDGRIAFPIEPDQTRQHDPGPKYRVYKDDQGRYMVSIYIRYTEGFCDYKKNRGYDEFILLGNPEELYLNEANIAGNQKTTIEGKVANPRISGGYWQGDIAQEWIPLKV